MAGRNAQKRKTEKRKARQQEAWERYLAHFKPPADMFKVALLRRMGIDRTNLLNKQYVVRTFGK